MADEAPRSGRTDLTLSLTLSGEEAFVDTVKALAARIGEFAGCPAGDAATLGQALGQAVHGIAQAAPAGAPVPMVDIAFQSNGRLLSIDMSCEAGEAGDFPLEETLAASGDESAIRTLVDRVEFARAGSRQICRLTRQIRPAR